MVCVATMFIRLPSPTGGYLNLGDGIIPHGTVEELRRDYGIDADAIVRSASELNGRDMVET